MEQRQIERRLDERRVTISEVNMAQSYILTKDAWGNPIRVSFNFHDAVVTVPQVNELWYLKRRDNQWTLDRKAETGTEATSLTTLSAGDKRLEASNDLYLAAGNNVYLNGILLQNNTTAVSWTNITGKPTAFPPTAHKATHTTGGTDAFTSSDTLDALARSAILTNGTLTANRRGINLVAGTNVTLSSADNSGSERVDITINSTGVTASNSSWFTLASGTSSGATSATVDRSIAGTAWISSGRDFYVLIGIGSSFCEVRKGTVSGSIVTFDQPLWFTHSSSDLVLFTYANEFSPMFWGAKGDDIVDDTNAVQAALDQMSIYGSTLNGFQTPHKITRPILHTSGARARELYLYCSGFTSVAEAAGGAYMSSNHPVMLCSADAATNTFTLTRGNGTVPGTIDWKITFANCQGQTLPGGIVAGKVYYVKTWTGTGVIGDTFTIAATVGGATLDITSNGTCTVYQKLEGGARPYLDDVYLQGNNITGLNGFRLELQQPVKCYKIRADNFPGTGIMIGGNAVTQQGIIENVEAISCGVGVYLGGSFLTITKLDVEACGWGCYVSGLGHHIYDFYSEANTLGDLRMISGCSRGHLISGATFGHNGGTTTNPPFLIEDANSAYVLEDAYFYGSSPGDTLIYDNVRIQQMLFEDIVGSNPSVGTLIQPSGFNYWTYVDKLSVNATNGLNWTRSASSANGGTTLYSGSGAPSGIGIDGDFYLRTGTPAIVGQRIYTRSAGTWISVDSALQEIITNSQSGSYTLVLTDESKVIEMTSASAVNLTIPPNSSVAFPIGATIELNRYGAGEVSVVAGGGVTVRSPSSFLRLTNQYSSASLRKKGTDEWILAGDLKA